MINQHNINQRFRTHIVKFTTAVACASISLAGFGNDAGSEENTDNDYQSTTSLTTLYESTRGSLLPAAPESSREHTLGELSLEISRFVRPRDQWLFGTVVNVKVERMDSDRTQTADNRQFLELEQLWAGWLPGIAWIEELKAGRFPIEDNRRWWWDEDVNGVSARVALGDSTLSLTAANADDPPGTLDEPVDEEEQSIVWGLAKLELEPQFADLVSLYYVHRDDRSSQYTTGQQVDKSRFDERDDRYNWFGFSLEKTWAPGFGEFLFQLDAAWLDGNSWVFVPGEEEDEQDEEVSADTDDTTPGLSTLATVESSRKLSPSGWAYDLQLTWAPGFWQGGSLSIGYATGTTDFRQTGLQSNEGEYTRYGELFDPELANLDITTARLTLPLNHRVRLHLQHNRYRRASLANEEIEAGISIEVTPWLRDIGYESAITLDYEIIDALDVSLTGARFSAGRGISRGQDRQLENFTVELNYEF